MAHIAPPGAGINLSVPDFGAERRGVSQGEENRKEERVRAALHVRLGDDASATTRDVSASGIFFETDASFPLSSSISFAIELDAAGGKMVMNCRGEIVRVERSDRRVGVAVRIVESSLRAAAPPAA